MQRSEEHSPPDNFEWELSLFLLIFVELKMTFSGFNFSLFYWILSEF